MTADGAAETKPAAPARVVIGTDLIADRGPQRRDRDRTGVIRVVLVRRPRREQPDPGAELGLDIDDLLAGRYQLLGQHVTQPGRASTARTRSGQVAAHSSNSTAWPERARTRNSPSGVSAGSIAAAVWDPLCGSTPIITAAIQNALPVAGTGHWHKTRHG
jgi:hypothetical protein